MRATSQTLIRLDSYLMIRSIILISLSSLYIITMSVKVLKPSLYVKQKEKKRLVY